MIPFARGMGLLVAVGVLTAVACGSAPATSYDRVRGTGLTLTIDEVRNTGFKTTREYDVEGLTGATGAWFGFRRVSGLDPTEYEIRVYSSHGDAIEYGVFFAQDVVGKDANIITKDAAWKIGTADRWIYRLPLGSANANLEPKYHDYVIIGNLIVLCQGIDPPASQQACDWMAAQLEAASRA